MVGIVKQSPAGEEERLTDLLRKRNAGTATTPEQKQLQDALANRFPMQGGPEANPDLPIGFDMPPSADRYLATVTSQGALGTQQLDFGTRADLGLSDTANEKIAKFKRYFPQGELMEIEVPPELDTYEAGHRVMLFRRSPEEPFARLDPTGPEAGDIADLSQAGPQMVGEGVAALRSRGASALSRIVRVGMGGAAGELGRDVSERVRGIKTDPWFDTAERTATAGLTSLLGAAAGDIIGRGMSTFASSSSRAIEADEFARRVGLPRLSGGQLTANPLAQRLMNQAVAKSDRAQKLIEEQQKQAMAMLQRMVDPAALSSIRTNMAQYEADATNSVLRMLKAPSTDIVQSASALEHAVASWRQASKGRVDTLYAIARKQGQPVFDMRELKVNAQSAMALAEAGGIELDSGMKKVLNRIMQLPDSMAYVEAQTPNGPVQVPAEQVLGEIRSIFYQLSHPAPEVAGSELRTDRAMALARDFAQSAYKTFLNPSNINDLSPSFKSAWTEAAQAAEKRFGTLESIDALLSIKTREFRPQAAVAKIFNAGNDDLVTTMWNALSEEGLLASRWKPIQSGFRAELIRRAFTDGPDAAAAIMRRFQPSTLSKLMSVEERKDFTAALTNLERIRALGINDLLRKQVADADMVMNLVAKDNKAAVETLLRSARPGSDLHKSIRAGLIDRLVSHQATLSIPGRLHGLKVLNTKAINAEIEAMRRTGAIKFLADSDIDTIKKLAAYGEQTATGIEFGSALAGAEAAGEVGRVLTEPMGALKTLLHAGLLGRVLAGSTIELPFSHLKVPGLARIGLVGARPREQVNPYIMRWLHASTATLVKEVYDDRRRRGEAGFGEGYIPPGLKRSLGVE